MRTATKKKIVLFCWILYGESFVSCDRVAWRTCNILENRFRVDCVYAPNGYKSSGYVGHCLLIHCKQKLKLESHNPKKEKSCFDISCAHHVVFCFFPLSLDLLCSICPVCCCLCRKSLLRSRKCRSLRKRIWVPKFCSHLRFVEDYWSWESQVLCESESFNAICPVRRRQCILWVKVQSLALGMQ